ncbi:2-succinyl-5-enolpyruvyl-6-hydroxy-3-cyclohexene-1-carboxylic-acid synthase [Microlunatus sp. Y2014]|uniref:2-succinyl-5-enolpyruvyl-6-hydroxy-3- cyclohexene-1-carboxylic-acid synthase n=1 Tax=Microlunatus sp. Y2014 TaxID=3418488 RepID=UPI003DA7631E
MTTNPAPSTRAARVVIGQLINHGVTDLVLAPGSRNAPLSYAAHEAEEAGRLRVHVRIDERSAGFLALGLARGSGRPVPVITTSGTAAGNLLPAAMEAFHSRIPLLLITADRPATMINTGANQTTDQLGLFGAHTRTEARISAPDDDPAAWGFAVARLCAAATGLRGTTPGPVHLDVALVDPLTPGTDASPVDVATTWIDPVVRPADPVELPAVDGTVIVAGDLPPARGRHLADLAATAQVPLLAEPSSNARHSDTAIATYRLLLGTALGAGVRRVIMVGRPTLSRPVQRLLAAAHVEVVVVDPHPDWIDPGLHADRVVPAVTFEPAGPAWVRRWRTADRALTGLLADEPTMINGKLHPLHLARAVAAADPGQLVVGSSNPVRDLDLVPFVGATVVHANRGLAGIDGTNATAMGVALSQPERVTWALLGDLTFLHDIGGLLVGAAEPVPAGLRIVVANDDGGSIFATLEHGATPPTRRFERLFATPHGADLASLCRGYGVGHRLVTDHDQLQAALAAVVEGVEVVEVAVDRADRPAQAVRWARLAASIT